MKNINIFIYFIIYPSTMITSESFARCAVCVVKGMSGASIAVLVILSIFIFLAFANWGLKKILDKTKHQ